MQTRESPTGTQGHSPIRPDVGAPWGGGDKIIPGRGHRTVKDTAAIGESDWLDWHIYGKWKGKEERREGRTEGNTG